MSICFRPCAIALAGLLLLGTGPAQAAWNLFPKGGTDLLTRNHEQRLFLSLHGGIQTMILQPSFTGSASDFGLIIPTPAVPDFADEVGEDFFDKLAELTGYVPDPPPPPSRTPSTDGGAEPEAAFQVVETALVGIYKARVVKADTVQGLTEWLEENQFTHTLAAETAFQYYVENGWFFVVLEVNLMNQADTFVGSHMQPIVIRFPAQRMILPMKMAYLEGGQNFKWQLYVDTSDRLQDPIFETARQPIGPVGTMQAPYSTESLDSDELAPYASSLSPQILPGDRLARISADLTFDDIRGDLVFNLVTTTQPGPVVDSGAGAGGCAVSGSSTGSATGALALLALALLATRRRRRRRR